MNGSWDSERRQQIVIEGVTAADYLYKNENKLNGRWSMLIYGPIFSL